MNEVCNKIIYYLLAQDFAVSYSQVRHYLNYHRKTDRAKEILIELEVIDRTKGKNGVEETYAIPELKRIEINNLPKKYKGCPYEYFLAQGKRTWEEKHPVLDRVRTGAITAAFSLIVGITIFLLTRSCKSQSEIQQDKRLDSLSDSVANFQKHIKDSTLHKK